MVGRKSRRAHAYGQAKPLTRAGFEPFCVAAGRQYLSESPMLPFRKTAARTSLRRGSNPARSTCVNSLNRYRAEIFALPFCAFCAFFRLFLLCLILAPLGFSPGSRVARDPPCLSAVVLGCGTKEEKWRRGRGLRESAVDVLSRTNPSRQQTQSGGTRFFGRRFQGAFRSQVTQG